jgi:hypothetical protein
VFLLLQDTVVINGEEKQTVSAHPGMLNKKIYSLIYLKILLLSAQEVEPVYL